MLQPPTTEVPIENGEAEKEDKVNNVDTGHGGECKNESEATASFTWPQDKMYAV